MFSCNLSTKAKVSFVTKSSHAIYRMRYSSVYSSGHSCCKCDHLLSELNSNGMASERDRWFTLVVCICL
jgi:hypothetical protein